MLTSKQRYFLLTVAASALCIVAVIAWQGRRQSFRGRYTDGFETSRFVPCGSSEKWWAEGNIEPIYRAYNPSYNGKNLPGESPNISFHTGYVEVRGRVTRRGSYGHEGNYDRKLRIEEVIKVQDEVPSSCK